jgi:hypothetical protein
MSTISVASFKSSFVKGSLRNTVLEAEITEESFSIEVAIAVNSASLSISENLSLKRYDG